MDHFAEWMWYLLLSPFKKVKKERNQWFIFCRVIGSCFDAYLQDLFRAREETMVASCADELLPYHASDRKMERYAGETMDNFRRRIARYEEVKRLGGCKEGILQAARSLGYETVEFVLAKKLKHAPERWAEFYLIIHFDVDDTAPVDFSILREDIRKVKCSGSKDNYMFQYSLQVTGFSAFQAVLYGYYVLEYFCWLDGSWMLDGSVSLGACRREEEELIVSETVKTKRYMTKEAEARITGNISPVKYIALGTGAGETGTERRHFAEDRQLFDELIRKEVDTVTKMDDITYQFGITLDQEEVIGSKINELALIDADGDIILFSTFAPKTKERAEDKYTVSIS